MSDSSAFGGKILVLEDEPGIRTLLQRTLERAGYRVKAAANVTEARAHLAHENIGILLLDYRLEAGENGLQFYRQLQAEGSNLPAILVTGFGDEQRILEALRAGVRDFIPKTPNFVELVPATVERVISHVRQERKLEEAESASRAKDDFLAALSHELRTPLTPVLALVSELRLDERLPAEVRDDLVTIHRNIELEARLIDDLLDLTRVTRGKLVLQMEPIDLRSIIEYAVKTCREGVSDKELVWMCNLPERPLPVRADSGRITQVLWNLLKNAAKFTPDHGSITIAGTLEEGDRQPTVIVQVTDNGIGIEPDLLPRIFGAFEQGDRTITRRFGGLGLGLAISKAIVELHRGTLVAESAGPGQGAIFTLRLPMSSQTIAAPLPKDTPGPREVSRPSLPSAHILLVEDHADTAAIMTRMLRHAGFDVTAACGVQDALCKIEQAGANGSDREHPRPVQLVVSDLGLPDGSGIEMMTTLREKYLVPGIALSGFGMEDDIRRSEAAGFAKHLTKPVDFERLVEAIRQVLA